jgi:alpha-glucosidase
MREWWKDAVFYQIYPRSYADSNGDGIGDLKGIESRLDYLSGLGVDALWISPFFASPMRDFGYDVADYRGIDPMFGTAEDFASLSKAAHAKGIRIVLDLVVNHSSDEHPWFKAARASKASREHGYYIWKPLAGKVPNNWKSLFELRSAWYPNEATGERYLATFTRFQPEFDWRNPELRKEIYDIMGFWYERGGDGFRLDVATAYFKDAEFRSNPFSWKLVPDLCQKHLYDRNRPEVHEVFKEMRRISDTAGERVLIGETHGQEAALAAASHGEKGDELHMAFNFDFLNQPWSARAFRKSAEAWYALLPEGAWPNFTLSNHDRPRAAFRFRSRDPRVTESRARVAAAMLLTLRGTPFIYYGEEIAMTCERIPKARLLDPLGIRTWPLAFVGRDPERTPMQWSAEAGAGFGATKSQPWLPLNSDWRERNVAAQDADEASMLSWYRRILSLRKARASLREGELRFLDLASGRGADDVLSYERAVGGEKTLIVLNFASEPRAVELKGGASVLLAATPVGGEACKAGERLGSGSLGLGPCEALILEPDA